MTVQKKKGYAFLDVETTGFTNNDVIQFSCILTDLNLGLLAKYDIYVLPECEIEEEATKVHHIDMERLRFLAKGRTFNHIAKLVYVILRDYVIVGHNIKYDIQALATAFKRYKNYELNINKIDTIDTMIRYKELLAIPMYRGGAKLLKYPSNKEVCQYALFKLQKDFDYYEELYGKIFKKNPKLHDALFDSFCVLMNFKILM